MENQKSVYIHIDVSSVLLTGPTQITLSLHTFLSPSFSRLNYIFVAAYSGNLIGKCVPLFLWYVCVFIIRLCDSGLYLHASHYRCTYLIYFSNKNVPCIDSWAEELSTCSRHTRTALNLPLTYIFQDGGCCCTSWCRGRIGWWIMRWGRCVGGRGRQEAG